MIDNAIIPGLIGFIITFFLWIIGGDKYAVDDPTLIGGKRDIIPGTVGILLALAIAGLMEFPVKGAALTSAIFGPVIASLSFVVFKKIRS